MNDLLNRSLHVDLYIHNVEVYLHFLSIYKEVRRFTRAAASGSVTTAMEMNLMHAACMDAKYA